MSIVMLGEKENEKGGIIIRETFYKKEKVSELKLILKELDKEIARAPEGTIKVCPNNGSFQYYLRKEPKGIPAYCSKSSLPLITELVQKEYNLRLKHAIEKRLKVIEREEKAITYNDLFQIYSNLPEGKKILVNPYLLPIQEIASMWAEEKYQENTYKIENRTVPTIRGEMVRSKSEQIIADMLLQYGIPYQYEYPLVFKDGKKVFPDFRVMNVVTHEIKYWEHLGMMDDEDYSNACVKKINYYSSKGIIVGKELIISLETQRLVIDPKTIENLIKVHLLN